MPKRMAKMQIPWWAFITHSAGGLNCNITVLLHCDILTGCGRPIPIITPHHGEHEPSICHMHPRNNEIVHGRFRAPKDSGDDDAGSLLGLTEHAEAFRENIEVVGAVPEWKSPNEHFESQSLYHLECPALTQRRCLWTTSMNLNQLSSWCFDIRRPNHVITVLWCSV